MSCFQNKVMGHRGAAGLCTENTLASIRMAAREGAKSVEFDVTLLSDDTVVVHHDAKLGRVMKGPFVDGYLSALKQEHLVAIQPIGDVDSGKEQSIPLLKDVLELANQLAIGVNVEIKNHGFRAERLVDNVVDILKRHTSLDQCIVSSFDLAILRSLKVQLPEWKLGWIVETLPTNWLDVAQSLSLYSLHVHHQNVSKRWLQQARSEGYASFSWTVNDAEIGQRLIDWGVDGIISDFPDRMINLEQT